MEQFDQGTYPRLSQSTQYFTAVHCTCLILHIGSDARCEQPQQHVTAKNSFLLKFCTQIRIWKYAYWCQHFCSEMTPTPFSTLCAPNNRRGRVRGLTSSSAY